MRKATPPSSNPNGTEFRETYENRGVYSNVIQPFPFNHDQNHQRVGNSKGIRDMDMLESALAAPQAPFGAVSAISDPIDIAASYLLHLCRNYPFIDGNRRESLATIIIFLNANGISCGQDSRVWESLVIDVAASRIDRKQTADRLRELLQAEK